MKRITTILTFLMLICMGASATESTIAIGTSSHIKANGTFYDSSDNVVNSTAWCAKVVVGSVTLTGSISNYSGYIDAKRNATLTISVPEGMTISSYSMGLRLTGSTTAAKAGDVALSNSTIKTVAASSISAQSTSITFSNLTGDTNGECLIEITDFILTIEDYSGSSNTVVNSTFTREINAANGDFYKVRSKGALTLTSSLQHPNLWISSASNPELKLMTSQVVANGEDYNGGGDIPVDNTGFRFGGTNTYTLSTTQDRYRITGYFISCYTAPGKTFTITPIMAKPQEPYQRIQVSQRIYVDGLFILHIYYFFCICRIIAIYIHY